ncbi:MAG: hypothetical protein J6D10_06470 [Clostridia bacterium]|nr:hypothetical protein [Clostridia bacterium]
MIKVKENYDMEISELLSLDKDLVTLLKHREELLVDYLSFAESQEQLIERKAQVKRFFEYPTLTKYIKYLLDQNDERRK